MSSRRVIIIAVVLSVLLHLLLYEATAGLKLSGVFPAKKNLPAELTKDIPPIKLDLKKKQLPEPQSPEGDDAQAGMDLPPAEDVLGDIKFSEDASQVTEELPEMDEKTQEVAELLKESDLVDVPVTVYKTQLDSAPQLPSLTPTEAPKLDQVITAPPPEILEIPKSLLPEERAQLDNRTTIPELERVAVDSSVSLPSLALEGPLMDSYPAAEVASVSFRTGAPSFGLPDLNDPLLAIPDSGASGAGALGGSLDTLKGGSATPKALEESVQLDEFVQVTVTVARDKIGYGGCYQIAIRPNRNSATMPDIPKDVLFIIDRSDSISLPKFNEFKAAIAEVLPALSPADRFNIIAFSAENQPMFKELVPASNANKRAALEAVRKIPHGGLTDVFKGLAPYIKGASNKKSTRPLNIFLLTDGRSTVNVYEPNVFLKQIVNLNPGNVSVFPFSAGDKTNRLLLDYLGYLNRGRNCHVEKLEQVRDNMVRFFSNNNGLLVTSLRCQVVSGAPASEIFPRSLPNLYRGENLMIYGRFTDYNGEIVLMVKGKDATGQQRDLLFRRKLSQCETGTGDIILHWAGQKLLYLHARRNSTDNPAEIAALERQIAKIQQEYPNIYIPR